MPRSRGRHADPGRRLHRRWLATRCPRAPRTPARGPRADRRARPDERALAARSTGADQPAGDLTIAIDDVLVAVADDEPTIPVHASWHAIRLEVGPYVVEGELPTLPGFDPGRALTRPTGEFVLLRDPRLGRIGGRQPPCRSATTRWSIATASSASRPTSCWGSSSRARRCPTRPRPMRPSRRDPDAGLSRSRPRPDAAPRRLAVSAAPGADRRLAPAPRDPPVPAPVRRRTGLRWA